jgi:hypothetical protein
MNTDRQRLTVSWNSDQARHQEQRESVAAVHPGQPRSEHRGQHEREHRRLRERVQDHPQPAEAAARETARELAPDGTDDEVAEAPGASKQTTHCPIILG